LKDYIEEKKGDIIDENGKVIGHHPGALFFTLGERHGFTIKEKTPDDKPMYVVEKDVTQNTITVSQKYESQNMKYEVNQIRIKDTNWISKKSDIGRPILCRYRYRQEKINCVVKGEIVTFNEPQLISPGQSIVFYDGEVCLGGGIVE
jgi:tRNA-uridine 2-sulfurtransferase